MNKDAQGIWVGATGWERPQWLGFDSIVQIVDLRPGGFPGSATEQVKVTRLPGHTGGGYVKLLSVVAAPVQTDIGGRAVMSACRTLVKGRIIHSQISTFLALVNKGCYIPAWMQGAPEFNCSTQN